VLEQIAGGRALFRSISGSGASFTAGGAIALLPQRHSAAGRVHWCEYETVTSLQSSDSQPVLALVLDLNLKAHQLNTSDKT
jgi:hypothetical protein